VLTTGEGGMAVTRSGEIASEMRDLKTYDKKDDYRLRFNYKLTDIQAAVGLVQLKRLPELIRRRREIARHYRSAWSKFSVQLPPDHPEHIYFRFVIDLGRDCRPFIREAHLMGIGCERPVYTPIHRLLHRKDCPASEKAWRQCVSIPIYPSLTDAEVERVMEAVSKILSAGV
jgi:perosamine synthetase